METQPHWTTTHRLEKLRFDTLSLVSLILCRISPRIIFKGSFTSCSYATYDTILLFYVLRFNMPTSCIVMPFEFCRNYSGWAAFRLPHQTIVLYHGQDSINDRKLDFACALCRIPRSDREISRCVSMALTMADESQGYMAFHTRF